MKPFEEVKDSIAGTTQKTRRESEDADTVDQARAALVKTPARRADIAKQLNLDLITVKDESG